MGFVTDLALVARYHAVRALQGRAAAQEFALAKLMPGITKLPPRRGTRQFLQAYSQMPWLRAVTEKLATSISGVEWHVGYRDEAGTLQEIPDHPMARLLRDGTGLDLLGLPGLSGRQVRKVTQLHLDIVGEGFWALEQNGLGVPVGILPLPPHWVSSLPTPREPLYTIQPAHGHEVKLLPEQVIMFRDPDPEQPYERGSGTARALLDELNADEGAAQYISAYLQNYARPDLVVTGTKDSPLSGDDALRMEATWKPKFAGPRQAGKPMFASGSVQVHEIGRSFREIQMVELRQFERDTIVSVYGLPPEKLGILQNSNRATIEAADLFYAQDLLDPRLVLFRDVFQFVLAPMFDPRLVVWHDEVVEADKAHQLEVMKAAPYHFNREQWQRAAGLQPELEEQENVTAWPLNLLPVPQGEAPLPAGGGAQQEGRLLNGHPIRALPLYRVISPEDMVAISEALDDTSVALQIDLMWQDLLGRLVEDFGAAAIAQAGADVEMQLTAQLRQWIEQHTGTLIGQINETTRRAIAGSLQEGILAGEKVEALAGRIREVFGQASQTRSLTIAVTESTRAAGVGALGGLEQAGMPRKQWLTTLDGAERPSHASLNAQVQRTDAPFVAGNGHTSQYPGGFGIAGEDVNCRCTVVAYLGEEQDSAQVQELLYRAADARREAAAGEVAQVARRTFALQERAVLARLASVAPQD